jgi:ribosomal-protein-alanine N-acetyltransferase
LSSEAEIPHPVVRLLTPGDVDRVMQIEESAYPFPWTRGIFEDCLRVGYDCRGLQLGSLLVGYVVQTQFAAECHLLNLCVDPAWQRRRFGSLLLEQTIHLARSGNCSSVFLEVRPSNRAGLSLYRKRGFYIIGERPDYYRARNGRESAIVMRLDLDEIPARGIHDVAGEEPA